MSSFNNLFCNLNLSKTSYLGLIFRNGGSIIYKFSMHVWSYVRLCVCVCVCVGVCGCVCVCVILSIQVGVCAS